MRSNLPAKSSKLPGERVAEAVQPITVVVLNTPGRGQTVRGEPSRWPRPAPSHYAWSPSERLRARSALRISFVLN